MKTTKAHRDDFLSGAIPFFELHTQYWKLYMIKRMADDLDTLEKANALMREALEEIANDPWELKHHVHFWERARSALAAVDALLPIKKDTPTAGE
jgi:hypothetical protein